MIKSFRDKVMERVFNGDVRRVQPNVAARIATILDALHLAESLDALAGLSGYHALRGNRAGEYAVTVTRNWRIIFTVGTEIVTDPDTKEEWEEFHVYDVGYEDYH